jgi:hypothetical protein
MSETPSKSVDFVARIAIPLLAFGGGMLVQYAIAGRTLTQQEFATATAIVINETAQKNEKLKEWADIVIAQYVAEKKQFQQPAKQESAPIVRSKDTFLVTRSIADSVCLYPKTAFDEPYGNFIVNTLDNHPEQLKNMDARLAFAKAISDYRMIRQQYESTLKILKDSCGFLLRG